MSEAEFDRLVKEAARTAAGSPGPQPVPDTNRSLLEEALAHPSPSANNKITQEHEDLVLAWVRGEITIKQCNIALGAEGRCYSLVARVMRDMCLDGRVTFK
jgi:hypothetical protein